MRPADTDEAMRLIMTTGRAVCGAELWWVRGGNWIGMIPTRDGSPPGVWNWAAEPRAFGESWRDYVQRAGKKTREAIQALDVESWVRADVLPDIYFNLEGVAEGDA